VKQHFILTGFLLLAPAPSLAQVVVNPAALQQLAGIAPAPPLEIVMPAPAPAPVHHWAKPKPPAVPAPAIQQATARVPAPAAPPKAAAAPTQPAPPAAPKPVTPVTLAFAPGSADLPAGAAATLKPFCTASGHIAIDGRAPADPTDPSAAMRLSLSRALAVQAALTSCGVPPQNILPRALGAVPGQNEDQIVVGGEGAAK
jgi:outer membrane protein OmpA-like peptidoglycan-associated protein